VISVDAKKKETIGNFKNGGQEYQPTGEPVAVNAHDFPDPALGKAIPYGIYDPVSNTGWVSVGIDHDTAEFAVASIRQWWDQMGRTEVFGEDARVELIEGRIVDMNPIGDWHASCVGRLTQMFVLLLQESAIVFPQNPVRLSEHSEPQPDLAILRYRDDFYRSAKPGPADTLLVVEVADTSLERDQAKALYYARAGITQYWIVDLNRERVIEFTGPAEDGYRNERGVRAGEQLTVIAFPQISLTVAQIIG